jgi:hypothetical protein
MFDYGVAQMDNWGADIWGVGVIVGLSWLLLRLARSRTPSEVRRASRARRMAPDPDRWRRFREWAIWDWVWFG